MTRLAALGGLWIGTALFSLAMTLAFRVDQTQIVATTALGLGAIALGAWLLIRPSQAGIAASIVLGVVWIAVYVGLSIVQADEIAALVTDAALAVLGVLAAGLAWASRGSVAQMGAGTSADAEPTA